MRAPRSPWLVVLASSLLVTLAAAAPLPIASVEVDSLVQREGLDLRTTLRKQVERTLPTLDWSQAKPGTRFVLRTSVTTLDSQKVDGATRVSCVVSATLRDARSGALKVVLEGKAQTRTGQEIGARAQAEGQVLEAAIAGAMRSLPEAVRQAQLGR